MAIESVNLIHEGRIASITRNGEAFERIYKVITTDRTESEKKVRDARSIPRVGDKYPNGGTATVSTVTAEPTQEDSRLWLVKVRYDDAEPSELERGGGRATAESGLPRLQLHTVTTREPFEKDVFNNPVVNSAGDRFVPTTERDVSNLEITIAHRVSFEKLTTALIAEFIDTVNDKPFFGFKPKQLRIMQLGGNTADITRAGKKDVAWDIQLTMRFRTSWLIDILDLGRFQIDDGPAVKPLTGFSPGQSPPVKTAGRRHILDQYGHSVDDPVLLDGAGKALGDGKKAVFLTFNGYNPKNFGVLFNKLGLPRDLNGYRKLVR